MGKVKENCLAPPSSLLPPSGGSRRAPGLPPLIFRENRGPKGRKNDFWRPPPPSPYLKVWTRHCHPTKNWWGWGQRVSCIASFRAGYYTVIMNEVCCQDLSSMWKKQPETLKSKQKYSSKVHFQRYPSYQCVISETWDHYKRPMTLTNPRWFSLNGNFKIQRRDGKENVIKNNRFNRYNNNFVWASHFFVPFFAVFARLRRENA